MHAAIRNRENQSEITHRPPPPERRNHSRHKVDNSAAIVLVKIGCRLEGCILDLSLSGCRIRCVERFPVGIYTRVETEFRIEGIGFRLGGVVQAIHDRHTIGIRFLDTSSRKREQLENLIDEITGQEIRDAEIQDAESQKNATEAQRPEE